VPDRIAARPARTLRSSLAVLAVALVAMAQATIVHAAQRAQDTPTSEPWECTQCRLCKESPKKVCGDTKTCSSDCAQLCTVCSQKSLTGSGARGGQHWKFESTP
jgi:hypothetical protein